MLCLGSAAGISLTCALLLQKRRNTWFVVTSVCIGTLLAFMSVAWTTHISSPDDIENFATNEFVVLHGWVTKPADIRPTMTKLTVSVDAIKNGDESYATKGRILVNVQGGLWPLIEYGDEVTVEGKLTKPEIIEDFDYPHYLELSGIRALVTRGRVRTADEGRPPPSFARTWTIIRMLTDLRTSVENRIGLILPEPHGSLLAGLLTGTRRGLPKHLSDDFRTAGLTHIIAVSGFNVTIVLTLFGGFLFWIPIKKRLIPLSLAAIAFCLFVGGGAPVVRATIMGILGLVALSAERIAITRLLILWTAFLMVALRPLTLWYDASFQLSFLAVIGLSELSAPLKKFLKHVPEFLAIRESLTATVAAQIATIPLSIFLFKQFSLVAPLSNILVAPLIPLSMLLGSISVLLSLIWMPLGMIVGYGTWALLEGILLIAKLSAAVPFAALYF